MTELKSIWHKPSETPRNYRDIIEHHKANDYDNNTLIEQYDIWTTGGSSKNPFDEYTIRWAYVEDLIACEQDLIDTKKKLDIAVDGIKYMRNNCLEYAADYMDKADEILEQITALEQKD